MDDPAARSVSPASLHEATVRRLYRRSVVTAQITVPAVPGMLDEYVKMCDNVFAASGVQYTAEQSAQLGSVLAAELIKAYTASSRSNIVISFHAPFGIGMNYRVTTESVTVGGALRRLGRHPGGAAVRHRTRRPGVGAGRRDSRSRQHIRCSTSVPAPVATRWRWRDAATRWTR